MQKAACDAQLPTITELDRRDLAAQGLPLSLRLDSYPRIILSGEREMCCRAYAASSERRNDLPDRVSSCANRSNDRSER